MMYHGIVTARSIRRLGLAATPVAPKNFSKAQKTVSTHAAPSEPARTNLSGGRSRSRDHRRAARSRTSQKRRVHAPQTSSAAAEVRSPGLPRNRL